MKRFILLIILLLSISACTNKKPDFDSGFFLSTYKCDMSGYDGLKFTGHQFEGITVSDLSKTITRSGYGVFVLSRKSCDHCQVVMKCINEAAEKVGIKVYYLDAESSEYPIVNTDDYDILDTLLKPIEEELDGEITLQTPHFFTIIDGEFVDSIIGANVKDLKNPTQKELDSLVNKYYKCMKAFKK